MTEITNESDLYDYVSICELFKWIDEQTSEMVIKDIIDSKPRYNSIDRDMVNKFCKKYIKQTVDSFLKSNNIDVKCTEQVYDEVGDDYSESYYGDRIVDKSKEELNPNAKFSFDLINTDDNIGDVTDLRDVIDLGNRDGNFIIIGGQLIIGDDNATHSQLINEYIEKYLNKDIDEEVEDYRVRDLGEFKQLSNDEPIVFGHIINNMAFIETCSGYAANDAVNILKNQGNFKKIYYYDYDNDEVTRLAKKI